jgi:hypothetical protein
MQTARRPRASAQDGSARQQRAQLRAKATHSARDMIFFAVVFGVYALFVQLLEGIDADTIFLALFCTVLTVFIVNSIISALANRDAEADY